MVIERVDENENNENDSLCLALSPLLNSIQHLGMAMETACSTITGKTLKKIGFPKEHIGVNTFVKCGFYAKAQRRSS